MADHLPRLIELAHKLSAGGKIVVSAPRANRLAKELRRHLPNHAVAVINDQALEIRSTVATYACNADAGPMCSGHP